SAALIASDIEAAIDNRARRDGVCFAKGNSLPVIKTKTLPNVKHTIFAENHPIITVVFPHNEPLPSGHEVGKGSGGGTSVARRYQAKSNDVKKLNRPGSNESNWARRGRGRTSPGPLNPRCEWGGLAVVPRRVVSLEQTNGETLRADSCFLCLSRESRSCGESANI